MPARIGGATDGDPRPTQLTVIQDLSESVLSKSSHLNKVLSLLDNTITGSDIGPVDSADDPDKYHGVLPKIGRVLRIVSEDLTAAHTTIRRIAEEVNLPLED